jgi:RNA polymerase sigma factor (sigma-70 family)
MDTALEDLFDRYRSQGDVPALGEVFDRAAPELLRLALHLAPEAAQAEDLVQATFLKALEHAERFERGRALLPWLAGILVHEAARARRERARVVDPARLEERASDDPARSLADAELGLEVERAVRGLPEPYADVLAAHLLEGARAVDIAQRLERAPGTVRMQILRGLELLRRALPPSLATALLASQVRGHAAVRESVLARAAELAALPRFGPEHAPRPPARPVPFLPGGPMLLVTALAGVVGLGVLVSTAGAPRSAPSAPPPLPVAVSAALEPLQATPARASAPTGPAQTATRPVQAPSALQTPLLRGRVLDAQGSPVAGAQVELASGELRTFSVLDLTLDRAGEVQATTTTDSEGAFSFPLRPGQPGDLTATLGLLGARSTNHHAGQSVDLVLRAPRVVRGRITRAGEPVAGAEVRATCGSPAPFDVRVTSSDSEGRYEIEVPWRDPVRVGAYHAEGFGYRFVELGFGPDGTATWDLPLDPGVELFGRVTDATTGAPIAGATVGENWVFQRCVTTDEQGNYRLHGAASRGYFARAAGYGEAPPSAPMQASVGGVRLDFALAPGHEVVGRVVDEYGTPVGNAYVAAVAFGNHGDWRSTRADPDGRYRLTDLNGTPHALLVGKGGFATQVHDLPASTTSAVHTELPTLTLRAPQVVSGRALDSSGAPVANAAITLTGWNHDRFTWTGGDGSNPSGYSYVSERRVVADAEGRFWFGDLTGGSYELTADSAGSIEGNGVGFTLQDGEERDDLVVTFPVGARVFGRVVDEAGNPVAGASVCVTREGLTDGYLPCSDSGTDGTFEIRGLPGGSFTLMADGLWLEDESPTPWLRTTLEDVEDGPLEVVLVRGATIEGTLLGADGKAAIGWYLQPHIEVVEGEIWWSVPIESDTTDARGRFRLVVPRDTSWTIDIHGPGGFSVDGVAAGTHGLVWQLTQ